MAELGGPAQASDAVGLDGAHDELACIMSEHGADAAEGLPHDVQAHMAQRMTSCFLERRLSTTLTQTHV